MAIALASCSTLGETGVISVVGIGAMFFEGVVVVVEVSQPEREVRS